jgi:hypothetical protein
VKGDFAAVLGKRINGVIIKEGAAPRWLLFLLVDDGTTFEFYEYGDGVIAGSKRLANSRADEVRSQHKDHRIAVDVSLP